MPTTVPETAHRQPPAELLEAAEVALDAVREEAADRGYDADRAVGAHCGVELEDHASATHLFEADVAGYRGWRWEVTVAWVGDGFPVTVSEVLLRPGPGALVAREWVPWSQRVRPGDLGIGDLFPTSDDDERLVPGYLDNDDPALDELTPEAGLGRVHVLSREGRLQAASRWHVGEFGPRSDMARSAPEPCGSCGFYLPVGGSMGAAFGACCNEMSPADGHVVSVDYGCGAHSEITVDSGDGSPIAELVYDDSLLDIETPG